MFLEFFKVFWMTLPLRVKKLHLMLPKVALATGKKVDIILWGASVISCFLKLYEQKLKMCLETQCK